MHYRYLIYLLFFFIAGCENECVLRDSFLYDIYTSDIKTKPDNIVPNKLDTYWSDTGLDLDGKVSQKINIVKSDNINFCSDKEGIDIKLDQNNTAYILNKTFSQNDKFEISLALYKGISITDNVCENKDLEVYVGDKSKCKRDLLNKTYKVEIGDDSSANANVIMLNSSKNIILKPFLAFDTDSSTLEEIGKIVKDRVTDKDKKINAKCDRLVDFDLLKISGNERHTLCSTFCNPWDNTARGKARWISRKCAYTKVIYTDSNLTGPSPTISSSMLTNGSKSYLPGIKAGLINKNHSFYNKTKEAISSPNSFTFDQLLNGTKKNGVDFLTIEKGNTVNINQGKLVFIMNVPNYKSGGYHLVINASCKEHIDKALFYYVASSDSKPTVLPGEPGSFNIPLDASDPNDPLQRAYLNLDKSLKGRLYIGVKDNGDGYGNNTGYYTTSIKVPKKTIPILAVVANAIYNSVIKLLYGDLFNQYKLGVKAVGLSSAGAVGAVFLSLSHGDFVAYVAFFIFFAITLFAMSIMFGLMNFTRWELILFISKIFMVCVILSPRSWEYFSQNFIILFLDGMADLLNIFISKDNGEILDMTKDGVERFLFLDNIFFRFQQPETWKQMVALMVSSFWGFIAFMVILYGIYELFIAVVRAFIAFMIAVIMLGLLFSLAPLFFVFLLFKKTITMTMNWIKVLIQTAMTPILLFSAIFLAWEATVGIVGKVFDFDICTGCLLSIDFSVLGKLCLIHALMPQTYDPNASIAEMIQNTHNTDSYMGIPVSLGLVITLALMINTISKFADYIPSLATSLFGMLGADFSGMAKKFEENTLGMVGMDSESRNRRAGSDYSDKLAGRDKDDSSGGDNNKKTSIPSKESPRKNYYND